MPVTSCLEAAYRINSVFDTLAFTFVMLTLLAYRTSAVRHSQWLYCAALVFYFIAIRTKEYGFGAVVVLFAQEILLERRRVLEVIKALWGFMLISALILARYLYLLFDNSTSIFIGSGNDYQIDWSIFTICRNIYWYCAELLYRPNIPGLALSALLLGFGVVFLVADNHRKRLFIYGIIAFIVLLGPTLLFHFQRVTLYLYAPHFFMAFTLAAALEGKNLLKVASVLIIASLSAIPFTTHWKRDSTEWYLAVRAEEKEELLSGIAVIKEKPSLTKSHLSLFVSGIKPDLNDFHAGWGVRVFLDMEETKAASRLTVFTVGEGKTVSNAEFVNTFCSTDTNKLYLAFINRRPEDKTRELEKQCNRKAM